MIEQMIVELLSANTDLTGYTGGSPAIYPNMAPEYTEPPYVVYTQASAFEKYSHSYTHAESGFIIMSYAPVGIDADNYLTGKRMALAVRAALRVTNYQEHGLCVRSVELKDQADDYDHEHTQHGVIQKFIFFESIES